ncbi:hypothetical protein QNE37_003247 [Vibrio vulnificus]|nr:hypothetical protein [Vibrio vulnificus]
MDCRPKVIMDITGLSGKRTALDVIGTQKLERLIHVLSNRFSDIFLERNLRMQTNSDARRRPVKVGLTSSLSLKHRVRIDLYALNFRRVVSHYMHLLRTYR